MIKNELSEEKIIKSKLNKAIAELKLENQKKNMMAPDLIKLTKKLGYDFT